MQNKLNYLLDEHQEETISNWGGKARNLNLLRQLELNIPNGFILNPQSDLTDDQLDQAIKNIGGYPIAVRSSGAFEDMEGASFAGLYETYLEIDHLDAAKDAIKKCFESILGQRVHDYLKLKKIEVSDEELKTKMNVLVQKMILPKISGVAFTLDPIEGKEEQLLLECVEGLGERLVSGEITPSRYRFHYEDKKILQKEIGQDSIELNNQQLELLSDCALKIQASFHHPQDIEWCIDSEDKVWILQSRPITHISWRKDVEELTNADFKDGGISARVCTPYMYSLYEWCLNESMGTYFAKIGLTKDYLSDGWMFMHYGRGYWSASRVKESLKNIPGWNEQEFDQDLGIQKDYGSEGPIKVPTNVKTVAKAIPILYLLNKEYKDNKTMIKNFISEFPALDQKWKSKIKNISELSDNEFDQLFHNMIIDYYLRTEKNYFRTIYNNSNFQSDFKTLIEKLEKKHEIKINTLALMSNLEGVSHLEIQHDLNRLTKAINKHGEDSNIAKDTFNQFIHKHYHHGDAELDLLVPRWGEAHERVWEMARINPAISTGDENIYLKELNRLKDIIRDKKFYKMLEKSRWYLTHREKMREFSTRVYYVVRLMTLELGKRLFQRQNVSDEKDVFFFTVKELLEVNIEKSISDDLKEKINFRKLMYLGLRDLTAPNEFGGKLKQISDSELEGNQLKGVPCSSGTYTGIAHVATTLEEAAHVKEGEILITKFTDPGWTPTLGRVNAVITEVGGILSHAAVISREYGIPAVLNVTNVTKKIKTGQKITVDGDNGVITIEE